MFSEIVDVLITGVVNGSVYALMASGMALVYGVNKVFNFAYGSFYTMGGYLAWIFFGLNFSYPLVVACSLVVLFFSGFVTEFILVRPLRKRFDWEETTFIVTLGLAIFFDNLFQILFNPYVKSIPMMMTGTIQMGFVSISYQDLLIFFISSALMIGLMKFLNAHRFGLAIEAVAQDIEGAKIVGIPKDFVFSCSFGISTILVGLGGILLAPKFFILPFGGWPILVKAWVITALGGMGSIRGSLIAAYLLGIVDAIIAWKVGLTWSLFAWFGLLLGTLIFRPQGLLGKWG